MTPEDLVELEQIRQLKHRYMRAIDTHDFSLLESCLTEDVTSDYDADNAAYAGAASFKQSGRDDVMALLRTVISHTFISNHVASHPEIRLLEDGRARGIWRLEEWVHYTAENLAIPNPGDVAHATAHYYDEYVKVDDDWLIKHVGYSRIFSRVWRDGADELAVSPTLGLKEGWLDGRS